jgi:HSP20 family protein
MAKTGISMAPQRGLSGFISQEPFRDLYELQRGFNRIFSDAFGQVDGEGAAVGAWTPPVDVYEDENGFVLKIEAPEVKREDIKVTLDKNVLTISGERRLENEQKRDSYHRIERSYGKFFRSFTLSPNANLEAVSAEFRDGVLRLSIPKKEETKPKQIQVEVK